MARLGSVAPPNFARKSNDLQVEQRTMLHEMLDVLLDVAFLDSVRFEQVI
jgi:hypothetical protein